MTIDNDIMVITCKTVKIDIIFTLFGWKAIRGANLMQLMDLGD